MIREWSTYKNVIKYSIKFMRLLTSYIEDQGWNYNKENRVVYRGVSKKVLKNAQVGKTYRII